ncbi:MAG: hypothetical protein ACR2JB_25015 [Bryobacteraceae bacterium]
MWWHDSSAIVKVEADGKTWTVDQAKVREWKMTKGSTQNLEGAVMVQKWFKTKKGGHHFGWPFERRILA